MLSTVLQYTRKRDELAKQRELLEQLKGQENETKDGKKYFEMYPKVKEYMDSNVAFAKENNATTIVLEYLDIKGKIKGKKMKQKIVMHQ